MSLVRPAEAGHEPTFNSCHATASIKIILTNSMSQCPRCGAPNPASAYTVICLACSVRNEPHQVDGGNRFWSVAIAGVLFVIALALLAVSFVLGAFAGIPAAGCIVLGLFVATAKGPQARVATKAVGLLVIAFFAYVATIASTISFSH